MAHQSPTFVREGQHILAFYEDKLIAKGTRFAEVEKTALDYLEHLDTEHKLKMEKATRKAATHVTTPSGLTGQILNNTEGVWGEEVTVRWENGRISRYHVQAGGPGGAFTFEQKETDKPQSALEYLEQTLNAAPDGTKASLAKRINDLDGLKQRAASVIQAGASYADQQKIDNIVIAAEHEQLEVKEALDHLEQADAEAFIPEQPFQPYAVEQADLGRTDGTWLDDTIDQMATEAEGTDVDALLAEEPGQFVADLDTGTLGDAGVTREMAYSHITSKTAGFADTEDRENLRTDFLARVEMARRDELADRLKAEQKKAKKQAKKAKKAEEDLPDDLLFT